MRVQIIVDSTTDMTPQVAQRVNIVPLTVHFGDREYTCGVDITPQKFYELLVESDILPKTSQPTPFAFASAYQEAIDAGFDVVCITCSGTLSGTNQSASIAARDFPGKVHVVDSGTIAIAGGILTEYALRLVDEGLSASQISDKLRKKCGNIRLLALVDTLEYLKKGGRLSSAVALAGSLLNIKPVITIDSGEIKVLGKARGSRQGNNLLIQEIEKAGGVDFNMPLMLGYTGLSDALLQKYIRDSAFLWDRFREELPVSLVSSVVGTHVGPGAIAVAFFAQET